MDDQFQGLDDPFGLVRMAALDHWRDQSHRKIDGVNDDISAATECKWQDRATSEMGYSHISIFCSLGEWASNITDLLKQEGLDFYGFIDVEGGQAIYRFYTRFLLVLAEVISDLEEIVCKVNQVDVKTSRKFLSGGSGEVESLFVFINSVCKHKVGRIHACNHHLPIWFDDSIHESPYERPVSLSDLSLAAPDSIRVPKLRYLLDLLLLCYDRLDSLFTTESTKFKQVCERYDEAIA